MKNLFLALIALLAAPACTSRGPVPAAEPGEPLRIAAWNAEHLTAAEGEGCSPRDAAGRRNGSGRETAT